MARLWDDNAYSLLASSLTAIATSLTVTTSEGDLFPIVAGADYFKATLVDASGNKEVIKCTARSSASDTMTIARGQDGTTALTWAAGDIISLRVNASALTAYEAHIDATADAHTASAITNVPAGSIAATNVQAAIDELDSEKATAAEVAAHLADAADAHDASAISYVNTTSGLTATEVQAAIDELATEAPLVAHLADTVDAHDASAISYLGSTNLVATDVEGALDELDSEKVNKGVTSTLTTGYATTPGNLGTISTGTVTPDEANGAMQYYVNGGAHAIAPPANSTSICFTVTNNATAGAITYAGFTAYAGDAFTTTDTHKFMCWATNNNGISLLTVQALQ